MPDSFDPYEYVIYLRSRWRFASVVCGVAVAGALALSLLLPKRYTATARILIEASAGSDARSATALSPIYLESLRTYEHFAASDSLFVRALEHFKLREQFPGKSVESLKRRVLRVSIPRNTKILEISASLPDAVKAQQLAAFLAQETVNLSRALSSEEDREFGSAAEKQVSEARVRLDEVEAAWKRLLTSQPTDDLAAEIDSLETLRSRARRQLLDAEVGLAGRAAPVEQLRKRIADLEREIASKQRLLSERTAGRDMLEARRRSAQSALLAAENRLREVRAAAGYRSERLKVVDPGIVPECPSFPNLPLNLLAALLIGSVCSLLYLSIEFSFRKAKAGSHRIPLRLASPDD